ncbi:MAG: EAL domain-containing protein [Clostridiales bacterium]|jgi:lactose/cellobiose-specific phosphotransferase system IIC component|nr:EAL domain-containing protein [Clostridiales bacterium]
MLDRYVEVAGDISQFWLFAAIRRGLMYNLPLFIIGSMATMLLNLPIPAFQDFMRALTAGGWSRILAYINEGTLAVMSVAVLIGVSWALCSDNKAVIEKKLPPVVAVCVVVCAFLMFARSGGEALPLEAAANTGLFGAIAVAAVVTPMFFWLYEHRIFKFKLYAYNADNILLQSLGAIEPAVFTFLAVALAKAGIKALGASIASAAGMEPVFISGGLGTAVAFESVSSLLWLFGVHGASILETISKNIFETNSAANASLALAGMDPTQMFTKQFLDVFVFIGGSGSSLCLIAALILRGNRHGSSRFARLSLLPCLFNINELVVYGLPVVFNPFFAVPFIVTPIALTLTTYAAMRLGVVPLTTGAVSWTAPVIVGGAAATGSFAGALLQVFNLALGTLIYIPFVGLYESHIALTNKRLLRDLVDEVYREKDYGRVRFIDRTDDLGTVARELAHDIAAALEPGKSSLFMEFQPQISYQNKLIGAEALLRWNHRVFGYIPPPVVIKIATEAGLTDKLGNWIIRSVFSQIDYFNKKGVRGIKYSINLMYEQIKSAGLVAYISDQMDVYGIEPSTVEFELTEGAAFQQTAETQSVLSGIKRLGANLAIDDFGMGHSSLIYIKDYNISTVKLDKVLIEDILNDVNCQEIISSISSLCKVINMSLIAEHVETYEQAQKLQPLGCDIYQGFLFSKALGRDKFLAFARRYRKSLVGLGAGIGLDIADSDIRSRRELIVGR